MVAQVIAAHCLLPGRQQTHLSVFDVSYAVWPVCYPRKKKQKKYCFSWMKYKVPFVFTSDDLARLSVDQTLCVAMAAAAVAGFRVYPICLLGPHRVNGFLSIYF